MGVTVKSTRFLALDGLRGLAALTVLLHHIVLVSPVVDSLRSVGPDPAGSPLFWLATYTPLHLFWAGSEAVYVFFILSGFVLALPFLREKQPTWRGYYPKRLVRLYIPVWGSILLAVAAAWAVPRVSHANASEWTALHTEPFNVLRDSVLLAGTDALNSPLWSLQWELLFSLLLPAYLFLGRKLGKYWIVGAGGLLLGIGAGSVLHVQALIFMPMFGIGVLLAMQQDALRTWSDNLGRVAWLAVMALATVLLTSNWVLPGIPGSTSMAAAGATLIVFLFLYWRPAVTIGTFMPVQWAGSRSFSLYLVHEPIIVAIAFATQAVHPLLVAAIAVPLSLAVAELFYRAVERPSHILAQSIGKKVERRTLLTSATGPGFLDVTAVPEEQGK